ncbi:MAG: flagellar assembly protein FliW [Bacteriovoracaceae bacterium]
MKIQTSRFGDLDVDKKDIITFKEGILGFENLKKFFVVDPGDQTLILWLQSIDDEATAFPIIEPKIFKPDYSISLLPSELNSLNLEDTNDSCVYAILTIPSDVKEMSANLKAPVIINNKTNFARQIVLQDSKLEIRFPMYNQLKMNIGNASDDSKRTVVELQETPENQASDTNLNSEKEVSNRKPQLEA